jgi:hypothetical protein
MLQPGWSPCPEIIRLSAPSRTTSVRSGQPRGSDPVTALYAVLAEKAESGSTADIASLEGTRRLENLRLIRHMKLRSHRSGRLLHIVAPTLTPPIQSAERPGLSNNALTS